jgi:hypothetical protein
LVQPMKLHRAQMSNSSRSDRSRLNIGAPGILHTAFSIASTTLTYMALNRLDAYNVCIQVPERIGRLLFLFARTVVQRAYSARWLLATEMHDVGTFMALQKDSPFRSIDRIECLALVFLRLDRTQSFSRGFNSDRSLHDRQA